MTARQASLEATGSQDAIRDMRRGRVPSVNRVRALCKALDLEFYIGAPRIEAQSKSGVVSLAAERASPYNAASSSKGPDDVVIRMQEELADLRSDLQRLPERVVGALNSATAEPSASTPGRDQGDASNILPFMRPYVVGDDDHTILREISESAEYGHEAFAQDVRAAAGIGAFVFDESSGFRVVFHRSILPAWARRDRIIFIRAAGDSMEPTVHDGDLLALDRSYLEPLDDKLFVIHTADGLVVKRLRGEGSSWQIVSDNDAYEPRETRADDQIVGRLAWAGAARGGGT